MRPLTSIAALSIAFAATAASAETAPPHGEEIDEILVTSRPYGQSRFDSLQANSIVSGEDLARRVEPTLGETLNSLPGISSTYFGPAASRPVIRGLGGDRVRVLTSGIGSIDASTTSPDHAVALEPLSAERIEIIRGPGTLLYGSSAVGGVVNVIDGRIPARLPANGVEGAVHGLYGTAAEERAIQGSLTAALGRFAIHLDGARRKTEDLEIPGFAESARLRGQGEHEHEEEEEEAYGFVPNSHSETTNGAVGLSYIGDNGFLGVSYSRNEMDYGVPGHHAHHEHEHDHEEGEDHEEDEHHEEEGVAIDLNQNRFDLMGELRAPFLIFDSTKLRFGYADYKHAELEGEEIGTVFTNEGWEGRLELVQKPVGNLRGAIGFQMMTRDFTAEGEEAVTPPTETESWGVFAVEELSFGALTLEGGARFERHTVDADGLGLSRDFEAVSLSGGVAYDLNDDYLVGFTVSRSERAPNAEELYSDGPHLATNAYEVGNPALTEETALSFEAVLRKRAGLFTGALTLFYTRYNDFIYEAATGAEEDELPVFAFRQDDAKFYGGELEFGITAIERDSFSLGFDAAADIVRASLRGSGGYLPRIPPKSLTLGAEAQGNWYDMRVEMELVDDQDRVTANELPTGGYALLNVAFNVHPFPDQDITFSIRGRNLTDEEARVHTSFLKDQVPLPGRDIRFAVMYRF